jgi:hypothetical protein
VDSGYTEIVDNTSCVAVSEVLVTRPS